MTTTPPAVQRAPSGASRESLVAEAGGANVFKGPECKAKATAVLEKFNLPAALFPLASINEFGFNEVNGFLWMKQPARSQHEFPEAEIVVTCTRAIQGNAEPYRLKNLVGIKVKDVKEKNLFVSVPYNEIKVEGDQVLLLSEHGEPKAIPSTVFRTSGRSSQLLP